MAAPVPKQAVDCFSDPRWRLNNLYWITDKAGKRIKFEMNWAQERLFDGLHHLNLILKARQLGFTTFIQLFMLDACVWHRDTRSGLIAHTKDDAETIFRDKVKYPYDNLPEGVRAANPIARDNTTTLELANNSSIRVGTSLRGGTLQYLHVSEFGKICAKYPEKAREIITGALNTIEAGQMAFIESTAEGQEGRFYEMCEEAQTKARLGAALTPLDWKFHFYPWWQEPSYQLDGLPVAIPSDLQRYFEELSQQHKVELTLGQMAWYTKKAETQREDMKREYPSTPAEAFEASVEGAYYGKEMAEAEDGGRVCRVPYEPTIPVETWWDLGMDDETSIWFVQRHRREIRVIDYYANSGEGLGHYAKVLKEKPYTYARHCTPHDMAVREWTGEGKSRKDVAESLGLRPVEIVAKHDPADGIQAVRNLLPRCWFDEEKTAEGRKALKNYRKEWNDERACFTSRPRHDWACHPADAFRTGAMAKEPAGDDKPLKIDYGWIT